VRVLLDGIRLGESPRWHEGRLWFADWVAEKLVAVDPEGKSELIARVDSLPFSIDWLPDGRLLIVHGQKCRLLRREADGTLATHADLEPLSRLPWNEIVVDGRGHVYLNNIDFRFPGGEFRPGFAALLTPDGALRKVAEGLAFPNGMVVTPDNRTLIVAESFARKLTAFDVAPDGSLSSRRTWADLDGHPDGICLDAEGAVWSSAGPRCVRVREGGEVLETVDLDRMCFACMLGGEDGKTLFMVAAEWTGTTDLAGSEPTGQLLTCRAPAARAGWP
jgi:sugar lactone lactonase YvrE